MKLLNSGTIDNLNPDMPIGTSQCEDVYIELNHAYHKLPECLEPQELNSPSFIFMEKSNELTTNLQKELFELFEIDKNTQKSNIGYYIYNSNGCKVMDLDFNTFQSINDKHSQNCKDGMNIQLDPNEVIFDLIEKLDDFTLQTLSVLKDSNLTVLKLKVISANEAEETVSFYKNIDYRFEKILLDFISKKYDTIGDLSEKINQEEYIDNEVYERHDKLKSSLTEIGDVANYVYKQDDIMEVNDAVNQANITEYYDEYSDDDYYDSKVNSGDTNDQNNEFSEITKVEINKDYTFHQNTIDYNKNNIEYSEEQQDSIHEDHSDEEHNKTDNYDETDYYEDYVDNIVDLNEQSYEEEETNFSGKIFSREFSNNDTDNLTNLDFERHFLPDNNTLNENSHVAMGLSEIASDGTFSLWYYLWGFLGFFCFAFIIGAIVSIFRKNRKSKQKEVVISLEDLALLDKK